MLLEIDTMMRRHYGARFLTVILCLAALVQCASITHAQSSSEITVDYVLVVDVSGSMRGLPVGSGNADIFADVQENLSNFVGELEPGASIFVVPFADGVQEVKHFDIQSEADLEQVQAYVRELEANGASTHVYQSVIDAFEAYNAFRQSQAGQRQGRSEARRVGVLQVYTDGQDNGPKNYAMSDVLGRFKNMRQQSDWLYYSTLGVELSDEARRDIVGSDVATYNPQPSGTVAPTRVIELGPPSVLDFGNLMSNPGAERSMRFTVRSQKGLSEGFQLTTEVRFDTLEQQGAYAEVTPEQVDPTEAATLMLNLFNKASLANGRYEGTINFVSPEPSVIVAPNAIEARFRYQPKRTVSVRPPRDAEGELRATLAADPFRSDSNVARDAAVFPLRFNQEARQGGGAFRVRIEQDAESSERLPPEAFRINGQAGSERVLQAGQVRDLTVGVRTTDEIVPGQYGGTISVTSSTVEVDSAAASIPWNLDVAEPPRTVAQWAVLVGGLLLLGVLLFVLLHRFFTDLWIWETLRSPTLSGRLTVVEPQSEGFREIVLAGKQQLQLGSGGEALPDAEARMLLRPSRNGKNVHTKVRLEEGSGAMREPGEMQYRSFASETLRDGHCLKVPPYELEYNNP